MNNIHWHIHYYSQLHNSQMPGNSGHFALLNSKEWNWWHPMNKNSESHEYKYSKYQSEYTVLYCHAAVVAELSSDAMQQCGSVKCSSSSSQQTSVTSGSNRLLHEVANSCVNQRWDSGVWKQWQATLHIQPTLVQPLNTSSFTLVTTLCLTLLFTLPALWL